METFFSNVCFDLLSNGDSQNPNSYAEHDIKWETETDLYSMVGAAKKNICKEQ